MKKSGALFTRLAVLEARGAKRATIWTVLYIPAVFLAFGIALGIMILWLHVYSISIIICNLAACKHEYSIRFV